jgi:hypothetical protein
MCNYERIYSWRAEGTPETCAILTQLVALYVEYIPIQLSRFCCYALYWFIFSSFPFFWRLTVPTL